MLQCNFNSNCFASTFTKGGTCQLYTQIALNYLVDDSSTTLYERIQLLNSIPGITDGLVNYWPINSDLYDYIGSAELTPGVGVNTSFGADRFGEANSSIFMNSGYFAAPSGVYFTGSAFTISGWVCPIAFNTNSFLLSFGNGQANENVYLSLSNGNIGLPYFGVWKTGVSMAIISSHVNLTLAQWSHLSGVYNLTHLLIYINGSLAGSGTIAGQMDSNVFRTMCYIGRSNWYPSEADASAYFDDIRIYNRALSPSEILVISQFYL